MENSEEVFQILERFSKLKQKDIPKELDDYLCFVAKTGDTVYRWPMIKHLFREKLMQVIKDFYESTPSIADLPQDPNVDPFNYESMKNALLERLELFNAAPFTVQRICELLTDPRKQYSRIDKFMRAIEKNILVVSTIEPGRKRGESETAESVDSVINGDLSSESVDSDENDITFADLTAKLANDKAEGNTTEATKENGSTDKPDVVMKDEVAAAAAEPEVSAQPPLPSSIEDKRELTAEKPDEPKTVETKKPEAVILPPVVVQIDKPTDMAEDIPVQNDKTDTTSATDEAMPIEENKTEETTNVVVQSITITPVPEENGVVAAEDLKVTENGDTDVELKLTEEIITVTPKSPSKAVQVLKTQLNTKNEEIEILDEKRESEDLLDEPEPKKLRIESNYSIIPTVKVTPSTPQKTEEEMTVEPTKEPEIAEEVAKETSEEQNEVSIVVKDDIITSEDKEIVDEKENTEKSEVVDAPLQETEAKEGNQPESLVSIENGEVKPDSITELETTAQIVEKPESAVEVIATGKVQESQILEPMIESKINEDKPSQAPVEILVEEPVQMAAVVDEPKVVPIEEELVTAPVSEQTVIEEAGAVPSEAEESTLSVVIEDSVLPVVVVLEEEKPIVTPIVESLPSIEIEPVPEDSASLSLIDTPVPEEESVNIPAPLSPMQSSETTQEMDTTSNENKMDADDVVDGSNAIETSTMINKAATDDNAMEVDESVEPMDQ